MLEGVSYPEPTAHSMLCEPTVSPQWTPHPQGEILHPDFHCSHGRHVTGTSVFVTLLWHGGHMHVMCRTVGV